MPTNAIYPTLVTTREIGKPYIIINDLNYKSLDLTEDGKTIVGYMAHGDKSQQVRQKQVYSS